MIRYLIDFVELRTKLISVIGFTTAFLYYFVFLKPIYGINYLNFILFFLSMIIFDMATTAINHYSALLKETNLGEYDKGIKSSMSKLHITMKHNLTIIILLIVISAGLGIVLVINSNISVLLLGALSFLIGVAYTYGPKPIAYTPTGELFAGGSMGILLPVIALFTQFNHIPFELTPLLIVNFFPLAFLIGNILFANNLCDLEQDVENNRYTLAYYTKKPLGKKLVHLCNIGAYSFIVLSVILGIISDDIGIQNIFLSPMYLILLITIPIIFNNTVQFNRKLDKKTSFPFILKNIVVFSLVYNILFITDIII